MMTLKIPTDVARVMIASAVMMTALALALTASPQEAQAQDRIEAEVRSIYAVAGGTTVDASLGDLGKTLEKAFKGYGNFKEVGQEKAEITSEQTYRFKLPDGTPLDITFKGKSKELIRLGLTVGEKFKSDVRASPGNTFFQAGLPYEDGILIIAITVK